MGIISNIVATYVRRAIGNLLPVCIRDTAVAWYKNLTTFVDKDGETVVKDEIGTRTDDVYYGQYLDATSGQINFYRTSGTFDYTDPSDGSLVEAISIPATGLYTIPANGICDIVTNDGSEYPVCERAGTVLHDVMENSTHISVDTPVWAESLYGSDYLNQSGFVDKADFEDTGSSYITGLLDFDGVDDLVTFSAVPDVTGNKTISFKANFNGSTKEEGSGILIEGNTGDFFMADLANQFGDYTLFIYVNDGAGSPGYGSYIYSLDDYSDVTMEIVVIKSVGQVSSVTVNGDVLTPTYIDDGNSQSPNTFTIGYSYLQTSYGDILFWDLSIESVFSVSGRPNGNLDSAWEDTDGSIDGTVGGTPTTTSIEEGGYPFETEVDGANIPLNDNTLVPLAQWQYVDLQDSEGENILDSEGEQLQVKQNL